MAVNRPRRRKNQKPITVIMHPIDDMELYKKSLGTKMLDILEKQIGPELVALSMEELKHRLGK
ncbi:hypothetical protein EXM65_18960 [Clostridium botulinum]|uniref:Uncharacterized protein n=1 Tax=Clostridium botulinum TaxID=1491 RepID=A0A6M0STE3_CLOBO|nr:hypothetical protein [Clostridium botulinum]